MVPRSEYAIILVVIFETKAQKYVLRIVLELRWLRNTLWIEILEIVKSDKVLKQVVERVNQDSQIDMAALNHDIAYKQQKFDEINIKLKI